MQDVLFLLALVTASIYFVAIHLRRLKARTWADQMIVNCRRASAAEIDKHIKILRSPDPWAFGRSRQDQDRIERLRDIRDKLNRQRNSIIKNSPLGRV